MKLDLTQALTAIAGNPQAISALAKRDVTGAVTAIGTSLVPGEVDDAIAAAALQMVDRNDRQATNRGTLIALFGAATTIAAMALPNDGPVKIAGALAGSAIGGSGVAVSRQHSNGVEAIATQRHPTAIAPPERIQTEASALGLPSLDSGPLRASVTPSKLPEWEPHIVVNPEDDQP